MADEELVIETDAKRWKHPRRVLGAAFIMGTALGAAAVAAKSHKQKSFWQKLADFS